MEILNKLHELGYNTLSSECYSKIYEWQEWYKGDVGKFHHYSVKNGDSKVRCRRYTVGMAKKVAEDWANLLMNEKCKITLEGTREQEFVDDIFEKNNFKVKANEMQEIKSALSAVAYVPRVTGYSGNGIAEGIAIDYVPAGSIFPLSWQNGIVKECAFSSMMTVQGKKYCYLQIHRKDDKDYYVIENRIYNAENDTLTETRWSEIKGYENMPNRIETKSKTRQFVIDKLNIANNDYFDNPLGISVYANAIDQLKSIDIVYDSYINEFVLGKKRIMVTPTMTQFADGEPVFDTNDLVFYVLPEELGETSNIKEIDFTLRTAEHETGMQNMLNILSSKCGFGENHYKYNSGAITTATQIVSENSALFRTLKKHETILESVLIELCRILLRLGNTAMGKKLNEDVEISVDFDDSIIEDKSAEFDRDRQMLSMGILNDWEFRSKYMNEDENTAKAALPGMEKLTTEIQEEIE